MSLTATATGAILVVDDDPFCRNLLVALLDNNGYRTVAVGNGKEALAALGPERPDLVLLDLTMPEMDGLTFLDAVRCMGPWKALPVIVVTATSDKGAVLRAKAAGVHDYVLKSRLNVPEVLKRVRRLLDGPTAAGQAAPPSATTTAEPVGLTREQTLAAIGNFANVKTLAGAAAQVISLAASPKTSVPELVGVLKQDPVLTARVLQLANSAAYATQSRAGRGRVMTIDEAVRNLGHNNVRNLAVSVGVFEALPGRPGAGGLAPMLRCWQHGFAVAAIMERIVPKSEAVPPGLAYLVGLSHDLSDIVLRQQFPAEYDRAAARAVVLGRRPRDVFPAAFGLSAAELVTELLTLLKLPAEIAAPIAAYFAAGEASGPAADPLAQALRLADLYAHGLQMAGSADAVVAPVTGAECRSALVPPVALPDNDLRAETLTTIGMLARLSPDAARHATEPLAARRPAHVWYARHPSFAAFDPVEAALRSMTALVVTRDRLPDRADDLAGVGGLVVAAPRTGAAPLSPADADAARRACGRKDWPVLHLSGPAESAPSAGSSIDAVPYPVTLSRLAEFVGRLEAA